MTKKLYTPVFKLNAFLAFTIFYFFISINALAQKEIALSKQYLADNLQKYQLTTTDIADMSVSSQYLSPTTGWYHIYYNQTFGKVEVFNSLMGITIQNNKVANTASNFVYDIQNKITNPSTKSNILPADALEKALTNTIGKPYNSTQAIILNATLFEDGNIGKTTFEDKNITAENIVVKKYWLPVEQINGEKFSSAVVLIWNVRYLTKDGNHSWSIHVDAKTGNILQKIDEVIHCEFGTRHFDDCKKNTTDNLLLPIENKVGLAPTANGYTVFDYPLESPNHGARTLVNSPYTRFLPAGMGPGTTNGWHNDGTTNYTNTRGNTVWAKDDLANDNEITIGSSPSSATLDFTHPYTQGTATAAGNLNAAITNLFYWNNVIHDVLWRYGFDEPSGNFQNNNMGKGGLGSDYVQADAQDGSGTDNANFSTPIDGGNGRMQMYIWTNAGSPLYQPDSDFDNGVIAHEYGHGWSIRLAGGPANSSCLQNAEQGGEGWGDYNGLMLTTNWAALSPTIASANIPRGIGTYVGGQNPTTGAGIRPYRYSYNKAVVNNVVTYGKVADLTFTQPHGIGSIWATVLWDMTWEIILQDNIIVPNIYDVPTVIANMRGNVAALKLVNEGLRLQPCSPSFVQARDAIFQADVMLFGGRYRCAIGKAFARRGLGLNASSGVSTNDRVVVEDFTAFPGPPLSSLINNTICSKQVFNYTATVLSTGAYTFSWSRATVVGISNAAASGNSENIIETLTNTTNTPIDVVYLITVSPDECGGTPAPQRVTLTVNPSVTPTVSIYNVCQNTAVPVGQGLVAPAVVSSMVNSTLAAGTTYNRGVNSSAVYAAAAAGSAGATVNFRTFTFTAPITASLTFATTAATLTGTGADDTYLAIYQNTFNPAAPATNFLRGDDDAGVGSLSQLTQAVTLGNTYILVVSTYYNNATGPFTLEASTDIFAGTNSWYTTASGGTALANTNIFNPVGIAGSGVANTNTAGNFTYYVASSASPTCRTATTFNILPNTTFVNQANVSGTYNGTSWATAYLTLQDALAATSSCSPSQIWVAAGTYKPTISIDRDISYAMKNNVAIYGGFPNTGNPTFAQRNFLNNTTILSGDIGVQNNNTDNSYHVISNAPGLSNSAILDGFTITGGNADGSNNFRNAGGALLNDAGTASGICNPTINNCIFTGNNAAANGGAIFNKAQNSTANPTFTNCVFENNVATNGGAFYTEAQSSGITNPLITNCTFYNNTASGNGSVLYTIGTTGTAILNLTNNIFWNNAGPKTFFTTSATINVKNSLLEPLVNNYVNGLGNITTTTTPFIATNNVRLLTASTAIDAGTTVGAPSTDADLTTRTSVPDMGAYENSQGCGSTNKTFYANALGDTYQWQQNAGTGFVNISNGTQFSNTTTATLTVINPAFINTGILYRCTITTGGTTTFSTENTLRFYNRWLGLVDNNWQNTANWSCGIIPNQYTDVIIPSAKAFYPLTNVSGTIRLLQAENGSTISIAPGGNLVIVGL